VNAALASSSPRTNGTVNVRHLGWGGRGQEEGCGAQQEDKAGREQDNFGRGLVSRFGDL
jgi:hypothetical protein